MCRLFGIDFVYTIAIQRYGNEFSAGHGESLTTTLFVRMMEGRVHGGRKSAQSRVWVTVQGEVGTDLGVYARILKPLHPSIRAIAALHPAAVHIGTG